MSLQAYIDVTGPDNMRVQKSRISREGKCDRRWQTSVEQTCTSWQVDCNMSEWGMNLMALAHLGPRLGV